MSISSDPSPRHRAGRVLLFSVACALLAVRASAHTENSEGFSYMGFHDGNVTALDAATGARRWSYRTGGGIISSAAVSGAALYIGSNDGSLYALDKVTGERRWSHKIGAWVASSPAVSGTGLVVGAFDGNLYGFALR
jgi:outer membrane protein assembly factor BamB